MDIHLRQRPHERLLRALVAFEQLRREPAGTVLRDAEFQSADTGDQRTLVIAGPVAKTGFRPLALPGAKGFGHLGLQCRFQGGFDRRAKEIRVSFDMAFQIDDFALILNLGHGVLPRQRGW